ncbi:hypothetical protein F53441_6887 [Fusarium austroafricanum]|uniref:Uncharacterized protein n=1 Tax=Fusarium austroafricanum TaxID=2364996 RepID=A0A8H4KGG9_9HYPO|nr:hypothetical protein F53441_6887 [Fusarium austroafricanum]
MPSSAFPLQHLDFEYHLRKRHFSYRYHHNENKKDLSLKTNIRRSYRKRKYGFVGGSSCGLPEQKLFCL